MAPRLKSTTRLERLKRIASGRVASALRHSATPVSSRSPSPVLCLRRCCFGSTSSRFAHSTRSSCLYNRRIPSGMSPKYTHWLRSSEDPISVASEVYQDAEF